MKESSAVRENGHFDQVLHFRISEQIDKDDEMSGFE
jgi:hypothetical protein